MKPYFSLLDRLLCASVVALVILGLGWELVWAPLRPGGSWLALKVVPLALLLPGLWRNQTRSKQVLSMLILLYVMEGVVRSMTDKGLQAHLAAVELALASLAFGVCLWGFYLRRKPRKA